MVVKMEANEVGEKVAEVETEPQIAEGKGGKKMVSYTKKSLFAKLSRHKNAIIFYKRRNGTMPTIRFCEGVLGLKRGQYLKYRPYIRAFLRKVR